jgi:hypothetical protein
LPFDMVFLSASFLLVFSKNPANFSTGIIYFIFCMVVGFPITHVWRHCEKCLDSEKHYTWIFLGLLNLLIAGIGFVYTYGLATK